MKKAGFTLVELLAVIVILAVILVIAVPQVINVINNSRRNSLELSVKSWASALEAYYVTSMLSNNNVGTIIPENTPCPDDLVQFENGVCTYGLVVVNSNPVAMVTIVGSGRFEGLTGCGTRRVVSVVDGTECEMPCGVPFVDYRDENIYTTIQMGDQCWFGENLRYTDSGNLACLSETWNSTSPFNACRIHGGTGWDQDEVLYQWGAAMDGATTEGSQGICPNGSYVPTDNDWKELEIHLGMTQAQADLTGAWRGTNQGDQLKGSNPSWCHNSTDCASSGFNALPAAYRGTDGTLYDVVYTLWWSSTPSGSNAWHRYLRSSRSGVHRVTDTQAVGYSVRCIKE